MYNASDHNGVAAIDWTRHRLAVVVTTPAEVVYLPVEEVTPPECAEALFTSRPGQTFPITDSLAGRLCEPLPSTSPASQVGWVCSNSTEFFNDRPIASVSPRKWPWPQRRVVWTEFNEMGQWLSAPDAEHVEFLKLGLFRQPLWQEFQTPSMTMYPMRHQPGAGRHSPEGLGRRSHT